MKAKYSYNKEKPLNFVLTRDDGSIFLRDDANATWLNFYDKGKWNEYSWLLCRKGKMIGDAE